VRFDLRTKKDKKAAIKKLLMAALQRLSTRRY
jgi:hypothetical protein